MKLNWNCEVCGDEFGLKPQQSKSGAGGTLNTPSETFWLCPVHLDALKTILDDLKVEHAAASGLVF